MYVIKLLDISHCVNNLYLPVRGQLGPQSKPEEPMNQTKRQKPWVDVNGDELGTDQIRELSPSWDAETWEAYLTWRESERHESLVAPAHYDELVDAQTENIFSQVHGSSPEMDRKICDELLNTLAPRDAEILRMIYFEGKTERQIALTLDLSRAAIQKIKKLALQRLRARAGAKVRTRRIMRGQVVELKKSQSSKMKAVS